MKSIGILILQFSILVCTSSAQVSVNSTGNIASSHTGSISYSVGQSFYMSHQTDDGKLQEGVQQPYEIMVITEIDKISEKETDIQVFPNPAEKNLTIIIPNGNSKGINYQIFSIDGKLYIDGIIENNSTFVDLQSIPKSTFILKISNEKQILKRNKIIKK